MSRGPGKWQRAILAELASHETFWLRSLLGRSCTKAEYNALLRAALKLEEAGAIAIDRWQFGANSGIGRLAVRRPWTPRRARDSVSVCQVPSWNLTNTYGVARPAGRLADARSDLERQTCAGQVFKDGSGDDRTEP